MFQIVIISGKFQRCFRGVSRKFLGRFKEVARVFQERFKVLPRNIEGCFDRVLSGFQGRLKEVHWVFEGSFKDVSRMFKEVLSFFFQQGFKKVSMKSWFAILFWHESHRSYPSRRRACYFNERFSFDI